MISCQKGCPSHMSRYKRMKRGASVPFGLPSIGLGSKKTKHY